MADNPVKLSPSLFAVKQAQARQGDVTAQYEVGAAYFFGWGIDADYAHAREFLALAVEHEHPQALFLLGYMTDAGLGGPKDAKLAFSHYEKAAALGHSGAQNNAANMLLQGRGAPRDTKRAVNLYTQSADKGGDSVASYNLGVLYAKGDDVAPDPKAAARYLNTAAHAGDLQSRVLMGYAYLEGFGVERDETTAAELLKEAAEEGSPVAQNSYGYILEHGVGVAKDESAAAQWYEKAAASDAPHARSNLGSMYMEGRGVAQDTRKAAELLGSSLLTDPAPAPTPVPPPAPPKPEPADSGIDEASFGSVKSAALAGDSKAFTSFLRTALADPSLFADDQTALAVVHSFDDKGNKRAAALLHDIYEDGTVSTNLSPLVAKHYRKLADKGDVNAQYYMGVLYESGHPALGKDDTLACRWYKLASVLNHGEAQYRLARCCEEGRGIVQDLKEAKKWYILAVRNGSGEALDPLNRILAAESS